MILRLGVNSFIALSRPKAQIPPIVIRHHSPCRAEKHGLWGKALKGYQRPFVDPKNARHVVLNPYEVDRVNFELVAYLKRYRFDCIRNTHAGIVWNLNADNGHTTISQKNAFNSANAVNTVR